MVSGPLKLAMAETERSGGVWMTAKCDWLMGLAEEGSRTWTGLCLGPLVTTPFPSGETSSVSSFWKTEGFLTAGEVSWTGPDTGPCKSAETLLLSLSFPCFI